MKNLIIIMASLFVAHSSLAQEEATPLQKAMQSMGTQFKTIATGLRNNKITEVEVTAAEQLQRDTSTSALHYPATAKTTDDKLMYMSLLAEQMDAAFRLEDAMNKAMETSPVSVKESMDILTEIAEIRKKGHNLFRTED